MLKNLSIKWKILSTLFMLGLVSFGGFTFITAKFSDANTSYLGFIDKEATSAMMSARAASGIWTSVVWAERMLQMDAQHPGLPEMRERFASNFKLAKDRLAAVPASVPSRKDDIEKLLASTNELQTMYEKMLQLHFGGNGAELPAMQSKLETLLKQVSDQAGANNTALSQLLDNGSKSLSASIGSTITQSFIFMCVGLVAAVCFAIYVAHAGITAPMVRLRERMQTLASGDVKSEIDGLDRKDEIGNMAAAVAVFRDNAIERGRLSRQADEDRVSTENERAEREQQKVLEAAEIQKAVDTLGAALGKLADGDLAARIAHPFNGQLDTLRQNFNHSAEKLDLAMQSVGTNARAIDAGANEIRSSADDLSRRTEQQAASVEETAAALEEITTTVKDSAKRAEEARHLVSRTRQEAEKSGEVVREAVTAMEQIEKSSSEIGNIIGVIDDIAFQTNLLALNAGVEAARAGEAGKGFAVVAQEVRELAQRSANAAKEIKSLITASTSHVETGVHLVDQTGKALDAIVSQVQEINQHVHAIAEATREQSVGLQEINTAVNTMDQGTQQNAAMVEETTAASHGLATEATSLNSLLGQFRLTGTGGMAGFARPAASRAAASVSRPAAPAPVAASTKSRPIASPARALGNKLASAFGGGSSAAATTAKEADWTEF
jgi:methyl-accepting chemotaxis protein